MVGASELYTSAMLTWSSRLRQAIDRRSGGLNRLPAAETPEQPKPETSRPAIDVAEPALPAAALLEGPLVLKIIAVLVIFYSLYFAAALLVPIAFAVLLSMLFAPVVSFLERLHVPRALGAALVVLSAMCLLIAGVLLLSGPAQNWLEKAPQGLRRIEQALEPLRQPLESLTKATEQLEGAGRTGTGNEPQRVVVVRPALTDIMLGTPQTLAPILSVFILTFFLLAAGDVFLRKLVTVIPTFKEKKRAVEIIRAIEDDISYYLLTFAVINVGMGIAMGAVVAMLGIPNPLLWGALVAILNFVPFVGAVVSMGVLAMVGLMTFDSLLHALAAPADHVSRVGDLGGNRHATCVGPRPSAQSCRYFPFHSALGLALGNCRRPFGGASARKLQDRVRAS